MGGLSHRQQKARDRVEKIKLLEAVRDDPASTPAQKLRAMDRLDAIKADHEAQKVAEERARARAKWEAEGDALHARWEAERKAKEAAAEQERLNKAAEAQRQIEEAQEAERLEAERLERLPKARRFVYQGTLLGYLDSNNVAIPAGAISGFQVVGDIEWNPLGR